MACCSHAPNVSCSRVTASKNKDFAIGELLVAPFGWRSHTVSDGKPKGTMFELPIQRIDPSFSLSPSTGLGIMGMPG